MNCIKIAEALFRLRSLGHIVVALFGLMTMPYSGLVSVFLIQETPALI